MPGMVVALGQLPIGRLQAAVQKLVHVSTHRCDVISLSAQLALGWAGPQERVDNRSGGDESGHEVHVWRYGHTFKDGVQPHSIDAAEILRDYLSRGVEACYDYEGSFVIVIADLRLQRLYVVPD